ncbi:helix-turn-helix transcriptional regulator [Solibacillus silvestris]
MRTNLKIQRIKNGYSQEECAEKLGCCRSTYADIENGKRSGNKGFWQNVQKLFDVPDEEMWALIANE